MPHVSVFKGGWLALSFGTNNSRDVSLRHVSVKSSLRHFRCKPACRLERCSATEDGRQQEACWRLVTAGEKTNLFSCDIPRRSGLSALDTLCTALVFPEACSRRESVSISSRPRAIVSACFPRSTFAFKQRVLPQASLPHRGRSSSFKCFPPSLEDEMERLHAIVNHPWYLVPHAASPGSNTTEKTIVLTYEDFVNEAPEIIYECFAVLNPLTLFLQCHLLGPTRCYLSVVGVYTAGLTPVQQK